MNKIFGIGLPRTGTASLSEALSVLGYKTRHYPKFISRVDKFEALVDTPICNEFETLDRLYPNSMFIWTIRDLDSWLKSIEFAAKRFKWNKLSPKGRCGPEVYKSHIDIFGITSFDKNKMAEGYFNHNKRVLEYFRCRKDILRINICNGEGWDLLCPFLRKNKPEQKFPNRNKGN